MKKLRIVLALGVIFSDVHAGPKVDELDINNGYHQPPNGEPIPGEMTPAPGDTIESTRFPPNRDVSDIPTTEEFISPTRSKTITKTISRPSAYPQQQPVVIDPVIAPIINQYDPYHPRQYPYPRR